MATIKKLLSTNITAVYNDIDIRFVDDKSIQLIAELESDPFGASFVKNPNGLQLILPQSKVTVVISKNMVQVADGYVKEPTESELITRYFRSVNEQTKMFESQVYGFNYNCLLTDVNENILATPLKKISKDKVTKVEGSRVVYVDNAVRYDIRVEKLQNDVYNLLLNIERDGNFTNMGDPVQILDKEFKDGYTKLKEILNEL